MQFSGISSFTERLFLLPEDGFFQNTIPVKRIMVLLLSAAVIWLLAPPLEDGRW